MDPAATRALVRPTLRALPRTAPAAGAALSLLVVALPAALVQLEPTGWAGVLRLAALAIAVGAAFVLDDPSDRGTLVTPTSRLVRRMVRLTLLLPPVALWWVGLLLVLRALAGTDAVAPLPLGGLTLEAAALLAVAVATAACAGRAGEGGVTGAVTALALALAAYLLPAPHALLPAPGDPAWDMAHLAWAVILAVAVAVFLAAGRDPAAGRWTEAVRPT